MISRMRQLLLVSLLVLVMTPWVGAQDQGEIQRPPRQPHPDLPRTEEYSPLGTIHGPVISSTSWMDTFEDEAGLTSMVNTTLLDGDIRLSQIMALGHAPEGGAILAATEAPNGKIYFGTSGAYLNVFDPAAGTLTSLGAPVPDECFG